MRSSNFSYLIKQGFTSVWRNRLMSFASFCIMVVSLLIITCFVLLAINANSIMSGIEGKNEVMVFVNETASADIQHIREVLTNYDNASKVTYKSPEQALAEERQKMTEINESYAQLFDALPQNPMPHTFIVTLKDVAKVDAAVERFKGIDGVESVDAPYAFAQFLTEMRTTLSLIAMAIMIALIAVTLVIVYNASRASVFARRMEINIMRIVGATNIFIRLPFFIEGMFIGILSGLVSCGLAGLVYDSVSQLFAGESTLSAVLNMSSMLVFDDVAGLALLTNCAAGALLGALGTMMSMNKHLRF
jgi:cell division transport system permease protein